MFPGLEGDFSPSVEDVSHWLGRSAPAFSTESVGRHAEGVITLGQLLSEALRHLDVRPDALAGHSVGEWNAMIAGGMFGEQDAARLLTRGDVDSMLVPDVDFGVLGCGVHQVHEYLGDRTDVVVSHDNAPHQTVVCGPVATVAGIVAEFRSRGVICRALPFRSGFHTPMLRPYLGPLAGEVAALQLRPAQRTPVWSATTASPFPDEPDAIRELYLRHLVEPVRFRELVLGLYDHGVRVFVQVGSGQLGSLIDDTLRGRPHLSVAANAPHRPGLDQLRRVATALWVEGGRPDVGALDRGPDQPASGQPAPQRSDRSTTSTLCDPSPVPAVDARNRLAELGRRFPAAAELSLLMDDVADAVTTVLGARRFAATTTTTLRVSTAAMPYLLDHCITQQREGWPDDADRRPVVPATTMVRHMVDAAERAASGKVAVAVEDVALHRWLVAAPATDVTVSVRPVRPDRVHVRLGDHADAVVVLADRYSPATDGVWSAEPGERATAQSADALYTQRWLFHGPRFQVVTKSVGISGSGVRGEITVPDAPGAMLDGVGHVLGQWLAENQTGGCVAFPVRIGRIRFHEPEPAAGTTVACAVRITHRTDDVVEADAQVSAAGRPVVSISGWRDRQFGGDTTISAVFRFPELSTVAQRQPGGWWSTAEPWRNLAARELYLQAYLASDERQQYEACRPVDRREWLLRRIAAKDAVRGWLWDHGSGPLFPAEIAVTEDRAGRLVVAGRHGLVVPALDVAVAHCREMAVVRVRDDRDDTESNGIRLVEILETAAEPQLAPGDRVRTALLHNPDGLPPRRYLVAWRASKSNDELKKGSS
nr:acyltransferase domain-containing protein [Amycolatopsis sp. CA-126428]